MGSVPSPKRPRTARDIVWTAWKTFWMWWEKARAGRWSITEARIPVPTFVGQAVR